MKYFFTNFLFVSFVIPYRESFHLWMPFALDFRFAQSNEKSWIEAIVGAHLMHIGALTTTGDQWQLIKWSTLSNPFWNKSALLATPQLRCTQWFERAIKSFGSTATQPSKATTYKCHRNRWTVEFKPTQIALRSGHRSNWIAAATWISVGPWYWF